MPSFLIDSWDDPRIDPYRQLKLSAPCPRETFIAEGEKLVLRLVESPCRTESILCTAAALDRLGHRLPAEIPVYVSSTQLISGIIGFRFHRGILAEGRRPPEQNLESLWQNNSTAARALVVLCPEIRDPANLGTIIRTAAAFGACGLVAGRAGTAPFSRRVLRTSMGAVLRLPIVQTDDWEFVLASLERAGFETIAAVLDDGAEPLPPVRTSARVALAFGNESDGLSDQIIRNCRRRVTLRMAAHGDSINVAVAAGIMLHHFAEWV